MLVSKVFSRVAAFHSAAVLRNALHAQSTVINTQPPPPEGKKTRPSVILGTRPHEEESRWANCALAQCLVNPHNLNGPPTSALDEVVDADEFPEIAVPKYTNYGVGSVEKEMLFRELPPLSVQLPLLRKESNFTTAFDSQVASPTSDQIAAMEKKATAEEMAKIEAFSKAIDLRNANAKGIAYENRRRIVLEFSDPKNPYDPGRAEVQAALLTYKIRKLWSHLTTFKRDVGNRRGLQKLVHERAAILKYLKKKNQNRYEDLLPRLALEPAAVEGELVV